MPARATDVENKFTFTKQRLDALLPPAYDRRFVYDTKVSGLALVVTAAGSKIFYSYRWGAGRYVKVRLGVYAASDGTPSMTIERARSAAAQVNDDVQKGIDPTQVKRGRREEQTLKGLFGYWLDTHAKLHKKTWAEDQRQFDKLLVGWHGRRLSTIKRSDIRAWHARIGESNGPYAANRALALLRAMFNRAGELGFTGENPARGVQKFREQSRDRFLQPNELPAFFAAVEAEPNPTAKDLFFMLLYTGARRSNVNQMRWVELDLDATTWRIPDTKNGEPLAVHLAAPALAILSTRTGNDSEFVFPRPNDSSRAFSIPKSAWAELLKRSGLSNLRIHDLRRTLGSFQAAAGASLSVIGKSLGHKSHSATAVYARLNLDPVRESVNAATTAIVAASKPKKTRKAK